MTAVTATWNPADQPRARPQLSCSKKISAFCAILFQRLSDDADVGDARLLYRIHDRGECSEGHILIGADEDGLIPRVANLLPQLRCDFVNVDGVIAEEDALILIDSDHDPLFGDFFDRTRFGHADFNPGLKHWRGDHENNQQNEDHIDQRSNVDIGESSLRAAVGRSESHQRLTSAAGCACMLSMAFSTSRLKSSLRAASSRIELPIKL